MRKWIPAVAVLMVFCLAAGTALAKAGNKGEKHKGLKGQIVSVASNGGSLVLETKGHKGKAGEQKTITITPSTLIEIDGVAGKHASDLKSGMKASVSVSGDSATEIKAGNHADKHKKRA